MTTAKTVTIVLLVMGIDLIVVPVILRALVAASWDDLARAFPGQGPGPGAVRHDFQSIAIGVMSFGVCVHIAVDERALHLLPARVLRWVGAKPITIPWENIAVPERRPGAARLKARVDGKSLLAPAWALDLAGPGPAS